MAANWGVVGECPLPTAQGQVRGAGGPRSRTKGLISKGPGTGALGGANSAERAVSTGQQPALIAIEDAYPSAITRPNGRAV